MKALALWLAIFAGCGDCGGGEDHRGGRAPAPTKRRAAAPLKLERAVLPEATVGEIEGDVRVDRSGRVRKRLTGGSDAGPPVAAERGSELSIGDALVVGATGNAQLRLPDQGRLDVGNESRTTMSPFGTNEVALLRGRLHVVLESAGRGRRVLKVAMPGAYVLVQGTDLVVGAADDGAARILAVSGPALVRTAAGTVELADGGAVEVDADGTAGRPTAGPPKAEAVASMDGWVQGRRELVRSAVPATLAKLAARIGAEVDRVPAAFQKVETLRASNRERLDTLRDRKGAPGTDMQPVQRQLAEASQALIEETDAARALLGRVLGRFDLARSLSPSGPTPVDALADKVAPLRRDALRLFRRSPRRPRPEGRAAPPPGFDRGGRRPVDVPTETPAKAADSSENH